MREVYYPCFGNMEVGGVNCSILPHTEKGTEISVRLARNVSLLQEFPTVRVSKQCHGGDLREARTSGIESLPLHQNRSQKAM